ncbi:MAG: ABC-type transporter, integral rane subunit [Pseudonocardiales bacterium]|nr:ABC-type transporter, integral rane subunit [Pseudonocardiales bacterium]
MTDLLVASPAAAPPPAADAMATARTGRRVPWTVWIFGGLAALLVLLAIFGPAIAGNVVDGSLRQRLLAPGAHGHLLGTDGQGRDVLRRLIAGARPSMISALLPVLVAGLIGAAIGMGAGLAGRRVHSTIMRTLDVFYAFPAVLLAIAIAAALGSGTTNTVISLSIVLIPPIARIAETETMRVRDYDFMESARASGAGRGSIAIRQVLPNIGPALIVYCTTLVGLALVFAGGLSFLGLGVAPPKPEWGQMINDQRQYMLNDPQVALAPAIVIFAASMVFNVLGDGLRDLLDVRRESR